MMTHSMIISIRSVIILLNMPKELSTQILILMSWKTICVVLVKKAVYSMMMKSLTLHGVALPHVVKWLFIVASQRVRNWEMVKRLKLNSSKCVRSLKWVCVNVMYNCPFVTVKNITTGWYLGLTQAHKLLAAISKNYVIWRLMSITKTCQWAMISLKAFSLKRLALA